MIKHYRWVLQRRWDNWVLSLRYGILLTFLRQNVTRITFLNKFSGLCIKGAHPCAALRSRVGAKGCWRHFFKNPTTQLRVDWVLTEKKCEQTPKFACFSVQRRPLHLSQAEMLPSHAVLKEGIK